MNSPAASANSSGTWSESGSQESTRVVCANCATINRVPRARLGEDPKCGSCGKALLPGTPFELDKANFDRHMASNDLPLVVDFWAPWCGPCRMMAPVYEQTAARVAPDVRLAKLDTDQAPDVAARFAIRGIPTLIAFRNGREIARQSGALDLPSLLRWIKTNV